jgi:DNA-binding response OmpR family regulator
VSVLVVGQDFATLKAVRAQLAVEERVYVATDEESAIELADRRRPEIIFVEVKHRRTGFRLVKALVARCKHVVVITDSRRLRTFKDDVYELGTRGVIPMHEVEKVTCVMVDMIRDQFAPQQVTR